MKHHLVLFFILGLVQAARVGADDGTHTYDFSYQIQGDSRIAPVQAFDDGKRTYIQMSHPDPAPAIFAVTSAGQVLMSARPERQFLVLERVEKQWLLTLGAAKATIRYMGHAKREDPPALFGATKPVQTTGSAPTPVSAEQIRASRATAPDAQPVASAGVAHAPEAEAPAVPVPASPPIPSWLVRTEDRTISVTLARWALAAGYAFSWDAPRDFPTTIPAVFNEPFEKAVLDVVMSYSKSDAPIKAEFTRFGPNKVLRIVKYQGNSHE
jgi:hypothetical protein